MADETELMKTYKELMKDYKEQAKRWREEAHEYACDADYCRAESFESLARDLTRDLARERRAMSDLKERLRNELNALVYIAPEDGDRRAASINRLFRIVQNETEPGATDTPVPEPADDPQDGERPQDLAERRRIVPEVAGPPSKIAHLPERLGRPNEVQVGCDGAWDDDDLLG